MSDSILLSEVPTIDVLNNAHYGQTMFVLGTSKSLETLDLSKLTGRPVIGSNDATEIYPVNYCLFVDRGAFERQIVVLHENPSVTVLLKSSLVNRFLELELKNPIYQFSVKPKPQMYFRGPLQQVDNTAHYAIEIAMRMKGTTPPGKIVLLGVDLFYPEEGDSHMFADAHKRGCRPNFKKVLGRFPETLRFLGRRKQELVTCSPWKGPLTEILEQMTLEQVLKDS